MALPMPEPTVLPLPLHEYKLLSFDVYGTLIQYKSHILASFRPLLSRLPTSSPYLDPAPSSSSIPDAATTGSIEFLKLFQKQEDTIKLERPTKRFDQLLREIWRRVAAELDVETDDAEADHFGSAENIASWPVFPGSFDALHTLSRYYKLVALSNIDGYAWSITSTASKAKLGDIPWYKVFTAEDFEGDPAEADTAKLEKLVEFSTSQGFQKGQILHVAQSLGHDHAPAKRLGIASVWLVGDGPLWGKQGESKMAVEKGLVGYAWRYKDLREFADEVEKAHKQSS